MSIWVFFGVMLKLFYVILFLVMMGLLVFVVFMNFLIMYVCVILWFLFESYFVKESVLDGWSLFLNIVVVVMFVVMVREKVGCVKVSVESLFSVFLFGLWMWSILFLVRLWFMLFFD